VLLYHDEWNIYAAYSTWWIICQIEKNIYTATPHLSVTNQSESVPVGTVTHKTVRMFPSFSDILLVLLQQASYSHVISINRKLKQLPI
jgi:hypothetical protein